MLTIIENVHIYEPQDLGKKDLILCNEKIIAVGENLAASYPVARRIDGTKLNAVPGFIDGHVHVTGGGGEGSFKTRVPELNLSDCIVAGVTTLVGLLGTDGITRSVENLVAKTKALNEEGITAYCLTGSYEHPTITLTGDVKKDIAFVQEILGVKIAISDHRSSHVSKEELIRLASDVRMAALVSGKPGVVVLHTGRGKKKLDLIFEILEETDLPIKHFRPTHVAKLGEQAIKFAQMGGYLDFTASTKASNLAEEILKAIKAGTPLERITLSSDANGSLPKWNDKGEMIGLEAASMKSLIGVIKELIVAEMLSIPDALSLVTTNVAKALELDSTKGRLRPGFDADILLFDRKFNLHSVIARGQVMMEAKKILIKGTFE